MTGTKRYSIGAAIADFDVISIILGALAGFYVAATNRPIPIWALSLNIGLALTLSIVYHSVWAGNVVFRTVGEVMMGRVVVDGRKHWTNPYGINRTLLFVVMFSALVFAPNYWQWAADERFYTELTFPVVLGGVVFFGCFLVGLVMVGRAQPAGAFLVVAFIALQAIGSLLDETPGVPTNINRGTGLFGLFVAPVAGVVLFRYYRSAANKAMNRPPQVPTPQRDTKKESIMNGYFEVLKKYAVFKGRARRKEYWMFILFNIVILVVLAVIDSLTGTFSLEARGGLLVGLYSLAILPAGIAVSVRRLHDTNRTGWWVLIVLLPSIARNIWPTPPLGIQALIDFSRLIGLIVLFVFMAKDSQSGENQYGPNPKAATA